MGCGASARSEPGEPTGGQLQTSIPQKTKDLFRAIEKQDFEQVKKLSEGNPDFPNGTFMMEPGMPGEGVTLKPGRLEVSLFITACDGETGSAEIVKHFLDANADINYKTNSGKTPIGFACSVSNMVNPDLIATILAAKPMLSGEEIGDVQDNRNTRADVKESRGWTDAQVKEAQEKADKVIEALKKAASEQ